ncbi:MAG: tetratricopeptide repeat protein [Bacteroidetes bacterium]|nr:tetratricopeptide repeat protein [Bacteroidota bacterium]
MIRKNTYHFAILVLAFVVLVACSTRKNTFTRRVYHNLTAHYNAYWNGNESLKEGIVELSKSSKDNYTEVLPVFKNGTKEEAQKINPQMDRAIEKGVKVIKLHSIFIKGKEHVRWIDDAYLMIGKSNYYKQEYRMAIRTFNFIISQYKANPIKYEAMIWLARSNNQLGEFGAAQSMLDLVRNKISSGDAPKTLERDMNMVYADYYIKQENYTPAIEYLIPAIKQNRKKDIKTRLRFILAQIYQRDGELAKASEMYQKVIRKNPPYEMAFNARINLAMSYDAATGDSKSLEKRLTKMLKDNKNKEFLDQIYYALAEVALRNKDKNTAIKYLKLSVSSSISNNYQKAISSLKLADLYFDQPDYENAQAYYDSTIMFLPIAYKNYDVIKSKAEVLNELVKNIQIVKVQDSLQAMALMTPADRDMKINNIIAALLKEEQRKAEEENANKLALSMLQNNRQNLGNNTLNGATGEWYFYNPSTMSFGFSEFSKKWGKRKLEDNWRISNKQTVDFGDGLATKNDKTDDGEPKDTSTLASNPKNKNYYLKDVPLTEEKMKKSNEKVEKALYNMGYIYYEGLKDLAKAKETFEILIARFPKGKQILGSYYQLYQINSDLQDKTKKDYYKELILKDYPESDYAKIITDPDYYKQIQAKKNEINLFYDETYKAFILGNYNKVIGNYQEATSKYKLSSIFPKFEYLNALSLGKTKGKDVLISSLNSLISKYPNHEIIPLAQMVLAYLNGGNDVDLAKNGPINLSSENKSKTKSSHEIPKNKETEKQQTAGNTIKKDSISTTTQVIIPNITKEQLSAYKENTEANHFFILMVDASKVNVNVLKIKISDFNRKYYSTSNLEITSIIYNKNIHLISVTQFENAEKAMLYYKTIRSNDYIYSSLDVNSTSDFVITTDNFTTFYKLKDLDGYQSFFKGQYLKK